MLDSPEASQRTARWKWRMLQEEQLVLMNPGSPFSQRLLELVRPHCYINVWIKEREINQAFTEVPQVATKSIATGRRRAVADAGPDEAFSEMSGHLFTCTNLAGGLKEDCILLY